MKKCAFILIFAICFALTLSGYKLFLVVIHPIKYVNEITTYSTIYNLDASIVASLINVESSYKENAKSNKNAIGLMQIKLQTANYLNDLENKTTFNEEHLFNTKTNIEYGCKYLRYLLNKFENIYTALAAYNAGETRVRSWLADNEFSKDGFTLCKIPYTETNNYIKKIKNNLKFYKNVYKNK